MKNVPILYISYGFQVKHILAWDSNKTLYHILNILNQLAVCVNDYLNVPEAISRPQKILVLKGRLFFISFTLYGIRMKLVLTFKSGVPSLIHYRNPRFRVT